MEFRKHPTELLEECSNMSGQQLTNFISVVHDEFKIATQKRESPALTLYYRDLLSFLIKTYGH